MKKIIIFLGALYFSVGYSFAAKYTISTVSTSFNPATTTANVGDTIEFVLTGIHTATQVEQSTWTANSNEPLVGGFNFSAGTNLYVLKASDVGTIYFICTPHASIGMKGTIEVQSMVGIDSPHSFATSEIKIFPNPVKEGGCISVEFPYAVPAKVVISNSNGKEVLSKEFVNSNLLIPSVFGKGIYLFQIRFNDKIVTKKVIIE